MTEFRTHTITARVGIRLICVLTRTVRFTIFGRYTMCGSCRRSTGETPGYAGGEDLFGVSEPIRLGGRYRLMNDIDASRDGRMVGRFCADRRLSFVV